MRKMLADNNLVRKLASCETMGGATTICSDKTGTLTMNRMRMVGGYFNGVFNLSFDTVAFSASSSASHKTQLTQIHQGTPLGTFPLEYSNLLASSVILNSTADIKQNEQGTYDYLGNVTECAMLSFLSDNGFDYKGLRNENEKNLLQSFPFSSEKKRMSNIYITPQKGKYRIYTKGASEIITSLCSKIIENNNIVDITEEKRNYINSCINKLASNGLRTIGLSYNDFEDNGFILLLSYLIFFIYNINNS
jgi:magnesium-transporting ATPase (P-type)